MNNFISLVKNVLDEQDKQIKDLFINNIVPENTFYKYTERYPSLKTAIKITNYLKVSLDYLFEFDSENEFKVYTLNELNFNKNLNTFIEQNKISKRKFCKDLNFSRDNIIRWNKGIKPSLRTLLEIANYFNCSIDDLLLA